MHLKFVNSRHWPVNPILESRIFGINFEIEQKPKKISTWTSTRKLSPRLHRLKLDKQKAWDDLHRDTAVRLSLVSVQHGLTGSSLGCWPVIVEEAEISSKPRGHAIIHLETVKQLTSDRP